MRIRCEIDFPALPTLSDEERERRIFVNPLHVHVANTSAEVIAVINAVTAASARGHWCVGFVAHEAAPAFDAALTTQLTTQVTTQVPAQPWANGPLAWFAEFAAPLTSALPATPAAPTMPATPTSSPMGDASFTLSDWESDTSSEAFAAAVEAIRADIREGRFYQVNYTTRLKSVFAGDAAMFYRALQAAQPRGYHAFIDAGEFQLLSISPELFFAVRDGVITTQPMKGTAPRGDSPSEDTRLAEALTHSTKERAENLMIVDLLRNDLSRIAKARSVEVPHLFSLHPLPSVWQMTSTVRATLADRVTLTDIFCALFPCGSVTGAPKIESMKAIAALEASPRGVYCGAIGVVAPGGVAAGGTACFNVGIRSVWIQADKTSGQRIASFGVGSGITYDSTVDGEAAELAYKSRFVKRASKAFSLFETIRLQDGEFALLGRHLARMENSARHFRFVFDRAQVSQCLEELRSRHLNGLWRVRLDLQKSGDVSARAVVLDASPEAAWVQLASGPVSRHDEFLQHKTSRRETYDRHKAASADIWDTLLWNEQGELTEFIRANLVLDLAGERLTPALTAGLLNGTLREQQIEAGLIREAVLTKQDLARADAVWWVNGLRGEIRVSIV